MSIPSGYPSSEMALQVVNATKHFSNKVILSGVNLSVEKGIIYGLLGPSGCGKTTLLSSFVGLLGLDGGKIEIFGEDIRSYRNGVPGNVVGYMPQEIALYDAFTIRETFNYYGTLHGISAYKVNEKLNEIMNILNLPDHDRFVKQMSGGESRRISLGIALLHDPKLLILDEPTVGVDPLLRERIWKYLNALVEQRGTTVILTTHYVEETSSCGKIGYLRQGSLLVEDTPSNLLKKYNATSLDDVVLELCKTKENITAQLQKIRSNLSNQITMKAKHEYNFITNTDKCLTKKSDESHNLLNNNIKQLMALTNRNWLLFTRYPLMIAMQFLLVLLNAYLGIYILGYDPVGLHLGIVNNEPCLGNTTNYKILDNLGCQFATQLTSAGFRTVLYKTELDARKDVELGQLSGYLSIPKNYTANVKTRFVFNMHSDNITLDGSTISIKLDNTEYMNAYFIKNTIHATMQNMIQNIANNFEIDRRVVTAPLSFKAIHGDVQGTWNQFLMPTCLMLTWAFFSASLITFHIRDRMNKTLSRTLATGVDQYLIHLSYYLTDFPTALWQAAIFIGAVWWDRADQVKGSWALIFLLLYITRVSMMSISGLIVTFCKNELEGIFVATSLLWFCGMASDTLWPVEATVWWYRAFCYCLPLTLPMGVFRSVMAKGWGIAHPAVLMYGIFIPIVTAILCFLIALWIEMRRKLKK